MEQPFWIKKCYFILFYLSDFIDEQYFTPSKHNPVQETTKGFYSDESNQIKTDEQYFTPQKYTPQKGIEQEIKSEKIDNKSKNEKKEWKKKEKKVVESSDALEYVRLLRKERPDEVTVRKGNYACFVIPLTFHGFMCICMIL